MENLADGTDTTSSQQSIHGATCCISGTSYAVSVLTFEGMPIANIMKAQRSRTVYAHHVVLCPLKPLTIGTTYMTPYSPAPSWVNRSKIASGKVCNLSGTIVPSLQLAVFLSEIVYRRKYGPIANLHWMLLQQKAIPSPVQWRLIRETSYNQQQPLTMPCLHYSPLGNYEETNENGKGLLNAEGNRELAAMKWYEKKLVDILATICHRLEPIIID